MQYVVSGHAPARIEVGPDSRRGQFTNPTSRNRCTPKGTTSQHGNENRKFKGGLTRALIEARVKRTRNPGLGNRTTIPRVSLALNPGYAMVARRCATLRDGCAMVARWLRD